MITTILVNVGHPTQLQFFFLVIRTFKVHSLSNFQIYNTVLLTIITMLHIIAPGLTYFTTGSLSLLTPITHFIHPHALPLAVISLFSCTLYL